MNKVIQFTPKEYSAMLAHLQVAQAELERLLDVRPARFQLQKVEEYLDVCHQYMIGQKYEGMPGHILDDKEAENE